MARCARGDVRLGAAVFVESDETAISEESPLSDAFRRLLLQIGGANIASADRTWSPPTSSSLADDNACCSFLLSTAERDPERP
jgi:hypothetical protein